MDDAATACGAVCVGKSYIMILETLALVKLPLQSALLLNALSYLFCSATQQQLGLFHAGNKVKDELKRRRMADLLVSKPDGQ